MTGWLLDTNILSELRRQRKVLDFVAAQPLDLLYVSTATLAEIRFGIELVNDASRRAELNDWLTHKVRRACNKLQSAAAAEQRTMSKRAHGGPT